MRDILLLLVLLNAQTIKVCSKPYESNFDGSCLNSKTEYQPTGSNLCCKKCLPGEQLILQCSETTETVCKQCPAGQYMESWNYSPNCFSCNKCKENKGLQYSQMCTSTKRSRCVCQPGRYCLMEFDDPYCAECSKYKTCRPGYGVSVPGTANSDVRCERCPDGTFSNTTSYTDPCRPHTNCAGGVVVRKGNATSDTVCAAEASTPNTQAQASTTGPQIETVFTTASTMMTTLSATSDSGAPRGPTDSTPSISHPSPVSESVFNHSTKRPPPSPVSDSKLVAVIAIVTGLILLFITIILLFLCRTMWKKDPARFHPKVDANGNVGSGDKINHGYLGETQLTSFTLTSPEQRRLLEKGEACSDLYQCINNNETFTITDRCSGHVSIGPLLSTIVLHNPHSVLSEPRTLLSNTEPVSPQPSVPTQSSSQPTSPVTPSVLPIDLMHVDSKLPFGEEEESFSVPQQETGKQSLMSVQESASDSA